MNDPSLYLQSASINDVYEIPARGYWDHTSMARTIWKGDRIVIGCNAPIRQNKKSTDIVGYIGTLVQKFHVDSNGKLWPSEEDGEVPPGNYNARYLLEDISPVTNEELQHIIGDRVIPQHGMRYLNNISTQPRSKKPRRPLMASEYIFEKYGNRILIELNARGYPRDELISDRKNLTLEEFENKYGLGSQG